MPSLFGIVKGLIAGSNVTISDNGAGTYTISASGGGSGSIPQYSTDPVSPSSHDAWVLKTVVPAIGTGQPVGLLLALTSPGIGGSTSYQFKYQTEEGTTISVGLT
jgi:hypothetical protein